MDVIGQDDNFSINYSSLTWQIINFDLENELQ